MNVSASGLEDSLGLAPVADATGKDVPASGLSSQQPSSGRRPTQDLPQLSSGRRPTQDLPGSLGPGANASIKIFSPEGGTYF